ncbi:MAG: DUF1729 domain-containing protein [Leptospirales bacterium]|nr:DUF1729 domain-containing protein [Leptospirales bacterium]
MKSSLDLSILREENRVDLFPRIAERDASFLVQFAGQGNTFLNELRKLHDEDPIGHAPYFELLCSTLQQELRSEAMEHPEWFFDGFDLRAWLNSSDFSPPEAILLEPQISGPLIFAAQIGNFLRFVNRSYGYEPFISRCAASIGHSQGINAALFAVSLQNADQFSERFASFIRMLLWQGYRARERYSVSNDDPALRQLAAECGDREPSPMAVCSMASELLERHMDEYNARSADPSRRVYIGLRNSKDTSILVGTHYGLARFRAALHEAGRQPESWAYLKVTAPYHSPHLKGAPDALLQDMQRIGFRLNGGELRAPVYSTIDGADLRAAGDLQRCLASIALTEPLDWPAALSASRSSPAAYILNFGPTDALHRLAREALAGAGSVCVSLTSRERLEQFVMAPPAPPPDWTSYAPQKLRLADGKETLVNRYAAFAGRPPIFGGGMTPTTVEIDLPVAAANAGRIVEWAGGGQVTEEILRTRLDRLTAALQPGEGIVLNLLFLDPYLWRLQFPLVQRLRREGYPIDGVTISAGVPEVEEALQILDQLEAAGLWLNSFKPGTSDQIKRALAIAKANAGRKLILQVEGGAAGGHHSWEKLDDLLRANYAAIRAQHNAILAVGGGIATEAQAYAYLSGDWNPEQCMPVDAVFLGTRLMAAREAHTASTIKAALTAMRGNADWQKLRGAAKGGGVISGKSSLGADIYYADNHWSQTSAYLEDLVAGKSEEEAQQAVDQNRAAIIERLERTAKPYFGEISRMSYADLLRRFADLTAPDNRLSAPQEGWSDAPFIDRSFRERFLALLRRFESRFAATEFDQQPSLFQALAELDQPYAALDRLLERFPELARCAVLPEDESYFLDLCRQPGKPVNFIPALGADIVKWYRSDALWYAHCPGIDPDSCAWIPGPLAIEGVTSVDEGVNDILARFEAYVLQRVALVPATGPDALQRLESGASENGNGKSAGAGHATVDRFHRPNVQVKRDDEGLRLAIDGPCDLDDKQWTELLARSGGGPIAVALGARRVVVRSRSFASPFAALLRPLAGRQFRLGFDSEERLASLQVFETESDLGRSLPALELKADADLGGLQLALHYRRPGQARASIYTQSFCISRQAYAPLHAAEADGSEDIRKFYASLWDLPVNDGQSEKRPLPYRGEHIVEAAQLRKFSAAASSALFDVHDAVPGAAAIAFVFRAMVAPLLSQNCGNLLRLLHLSHSFVWREAFQDLQPGSALQLESWIAGQQLHENGKQLQVSGRMLHKQKEVCSFESRFFVAGNFPGESISFRNTDPLQLTIPCNEENLQSLAALDMVELSRSAEDLLRAGGAIEFQSNEREDLRTADGRRRYLLQGLLSQQGRPAGTVRFEAEDATQNRNPAVAALESLSGGAARVALTQSYLAMSQAVRSPQSMAAYAEASFDSNPIHIDRNFAVLAGMQEPIVHGMWTASQLQASLVHHLCAGSSTRLKSCGVEFEAVVLPGQALLIEARHTAMQEGDQVYALEVRNASGQRVLKGEAIVAAPITAYVFTGQGSQSAGMGRPFYEEFSAARDIWDRAERTANERCGFSILEVVNENPETLRVGGRNWTHPQGVLNLTQFTQVALLTKSMADWAALRSRGLLVEQAYFAGHSLGEYAALAANEALPLENVIPIVYHRGLTMQDLVPRDRSGRSPFAMSVILGARQIGLSEEKILQLVEGASRDSGKHLEVVNFNVRNRQYSVTGFESALELLEERLRELSHGHKTCIRLKGIDVPFHSSLLAEGVPAFRSVLEQNLPLSLDLSRLDGRYIPNLVGRPFALSREFLELVYARSQSPVVATMLQGASLDPADHLLRRRLCIELLAYQFARPVLWMQTQDALFGECGVMQLLDIGARGDLAGMARQTLRDHSGPMPLIVHVEENRRTVFFEGADIVSAEGFVLQPISSDRGEQDSDSGSLSEQLPSPPPALAPASQAAPATGTAAPADRPLDTLSGLKAVLALKAGMRLDEIGDGLNIEELFKGNSSRRNQALADLGSEFNTSALDGAHEKSVGELALALAKLGPYDRPGPFLRVALDDAIKKFMPADFGRREILAQLSESRLLGAGHVFQLTARLPLYLRAGESIGKGPLSPIAPLGRFGDRRAAADFIHRCVDLYGLELGLNFPHAGAQAGAAASMVDSAALQALEQKYFGAGGALERWLRFGQQTLAGVDPYAALLVRDRETLEESQVNAVGWSESEERVARPRFDQRKVVFLRSSRQWAKMRLIRSFYDLENGRIDVIAEPFAQQIASHLDAELEAACVYFQRLATGARTRAELARLLALPRQSAFRPLQLPGKAALDWKEDGSFAFREESGGSCQDLLGGSHAPRIEISEDEGNHFQFSASLSDAFRSASLETLDQGLSFVGQCALITGAGPRSIALEMVKYLLAGGAQVLLCTSSYSIARIKEYKRLYQQYGARGAELAILPFSQGSMSDIREVVRYVFEQGYEPDILAPFGAIGEENSLLQINDDSMAGLRVMLLGVERLIAEMTSAYQRRHIRHKRLRVALPLSPNHGVFGFDGMYAESKLALESLLRKYHSEYAEWGRYTQLLGLRIGWVRGTGLMELNDAVAPELEARAAVRTYHRSEMGLMIAMLLAAAPESKGPLIADLSGGLASVSGLKALLADIRLQLQRQSRLRRRQHSLHQLLRESPEPQKVRALQPPAQPFPALPDETQLQRYAVAAPPALKDIICVVGFGEVSPGGSARTRWNLEKDGELSLESAIELAWMTGRIRSERNAAGNGRSWVAAESGEVLADFEIKARYEAELLQTTGIRFVEPQTLGFDPLNLPVHTDVVLEEDFLIPAADRQEARAFLAAMPEGAELYFDPERDRWFVRRKKGTALRVLKSLRLSRYVAGQIPAGWSAERYGIPRDLLAQVDRVTLFNLITTAEAFLAAGMQPTELYRYLHPAEVGSTVGSGMGGMQKLQRLFSDHKQDQERQRDVLQETLINVTAAYVMTSYVGGFGPIQAPVAACATAALSVEMAASLIREGKARCVLAGAFDDISEESMLGFADMNATAPTDEMLERGIPAAEMSRPNDSRRGGFVEAHGGATLLLARGDFALEAGLPVYGIIAHAASHADGFQASIPAPGQGVLAVARQLDGAGSSPLGRALARFGLAADDIQLVYKHDTSTAANDPNENRLHDSIQKALGRSPGNPLLTVSQKSLTGHSKGGAAAWQLIGLLQSLNDGIAAGNRTLDDVDVEMEKYSAMAFSDESIHAGPHRWKAGLLTSLGFGHVGALILAVHPNFFLAALSPEQRAAYSIRRAPREDFARRRLHGIWTGTGDALFTRRTESLFRDAQAESRSLLAAAIDRSELRF